MRVVVGENAEVGNRWAARLIGRKIAEGRVRTLGVATGGSPLSLYSALEVGAADARALKLFSLDEYLGVAANDPASYRSYVLDRIARPLGVPLNSVDTLDGAADDSEEECRRYEQAILGAGGIDLQILGVGSNGHIGFNEPPAAHDSLTRVVPLAPSTREANARYFDHGRAVPTHALTQGIATIQRAGSIILLAYGTAKATAIRDGLLGEVSPAAPLSHLRAHPDVTIVLDPESAAAVPDGLVERPFAGTGVNG